MQATTVTQEMIYVAKVDNQKLQREYLETLKPYLDAKIKALQSCVPRIVLSSSGEMSTSYPPEVQLLIDRMDELATKVGDAFRRHAAIYGNVFFVVNP